LRAWLVVVDSRSGVLLLLLGLLLSGFRALIDKMPGLSTIVAQPGRKICGFGDRLLGFLDMAELSFLLLLCLLRGSHRWCTSGALSGLLGLQLRLPSRGQVSVQVISHSLTSISGNTRLLARIASSSALRSIGSREGGNIESEAWG
jgi:hypothetical protein